MSDIKNLQICPPYTNNYEFTVNVSPDSDQIVYYRVVPFAPSSSFLSIFEEPVFFDKEPT